MLPQKLFTFSFKSTRSFSYTAFDSTESDEKLGILVWCFTYLAAICFFHLVLLF